MLVLDYLSGGKRTIPHEKIKSHEGLNCVPQSEFFWKTEFYNSLKNEIISDKEYENVFWQILHLKKLSNLNNIYNDHTVQNIWKQSDRNEAIISI